MTFAFIYSLSVYFFFHIISQADILSKPRNWIIKTFPWWMTYWTQCAFCFTFWVGITLNVVARLFSPDVELNQEIVFVSPVINYFLSLIARRLQPSEPLILPKS